MCLDGNSVNSFGRWGSLWSFQCFHGLCLRFCHIDAKCALTVQDNVLMYCFCHQLQYRPEVTLHPRTVDTRVANFRPAIFWHVCAN